MIDVIRKTCAANTQETFKFAASSVAFRVKNFTSDKIYVCLGKQWNESQSVRINSNMAETLVLDDIKAHPEEYINYIPDAKQRTNSERIADLEEALELILNGVTA